MFSGGKPTLGVSGVRVRVVLVREALPVLFWLYMCLLDVSMATQTVFLVVMASV